jgi:dihydroorotate dehydrogenase electron transfer subunit
LKWIIKQKKQNKLSTTGFKALNKIVADHKVVETNFLSEENYIIRLKSPIPIPEILPGNFAEIKIPDTNGVFLRRPFSVHDVDYNRQIISFYIKAIGHGTKSLARVLPGNIVNIIYPLGNSFGLPRKGEKVLIVAGGSGLAPFILLGRELEKNNNQITFLLGGKSKKDILFNDNFSKFGKVLITTEDGSSGEKGIVTQHSLFCKEELRFDKIYTCGPVKMMKAVSEIAFSHGTDCEVSLENMMACGYGVCLCCVTPTIEGNKRVCMEGPVFNANYVQWQI